MGYGEQRVADYDEALAKLQTAVFPCWRRPTEGGSWTKVRGVDWRRVAREDLEQLQRTQADVEGT